MSNYARAGDGQWIYLPEACWNLDIDLAGKSDQRLVDEINEAAQPQRDYLRKMSDSVGRMIDSWSAHAEIPPALRNPEMTT